MKSKGILLADRISVPTERTMTDAGQMHVPCKFARTGSQLYSAGQLGLTEKSPTEVVTVYRDEADVFDEESMATFRSAPVTIGHPKDAAGVNIGVSAENAKELQVGALEGMPTRDEDTLGGTLVLTNKEAIDALEDGTQELSAGYTCDIEEIDGKLYQRNIRANHIAIVAKGRAGSSCRISDEAEELRLSDDHPEPLRWDFVNDTAYENALACWKLVEANEWAGSSDAEGKAAGNKATTDEAEAKVLLLVADAEVHAEEKKALTDAVEAGEIAMASIKLELADAKLAATEGVIERCEAIEQARLIADMRDLGSKSVAEIKQMVVEDQMPDANLEGKSETYVAVMFDLLADQAKGSTPMAKLLAKQNVHVVVDAKPAMSKAMEARANMVARQSGM